jgi:MFS family permease
MGTIFLGGFFIIGAQLSLNALITNYYPTVIRGTGIGWSQVVGRTGSLLGPLMGGALVSQGMSPSQLFQVSSIAPLLACGIFAGFHEIVVVGIHDPVGRGGRDAITSHAKKGAYFEQSGKRRPTGAASTSRRETNAAEPVA